MNDEQASPVRVPDGLRSLHEQGCGRIRSALGLGALGALPITVERLGAELASRVTQQSSARSLHQLARRELPDLPLPVFAAEVIGLDVAATTVGLAFTLEPPVGDRARRAFHERLRGAYGGAIDGWLTAYGEAMAGASGDTLFLPVAGCFAARCARAAGVDLGAAGAHPVPTLEAVGLRTFLGRVEATILAVNGYTIEG